MIAVGTREGLSRVEEAGESAPGEATEPHATSHSEEPYRPRSVGFGSNTLGRLVARPIVEDPTLHQEAQFLLPWYVTARAGAANLAAIERHFRECPACREDLAFERALRTTMGNTPSLGAACLEARRPIWARILASWGTMTAAISAMAMFVMGRAPRPR